MRSSFLYCDIWSASSLKKVTQPFGKSPSRILRCSQTTFFLKFQLVASNFIYRKRVGCSLWVGKRWGKDGSCSLWLDRGEIGMPNMGTHRWEKRCPLWQWVYIVLFFDSKLSLGESPMNSTLYLVFNFLC